MDEIHALGPCSWYMAKENLCIECDATQAVDKNLSLEKNELRETTKRSRSKQRKQPKGATGAPATKKEGKRKKRPGGQAFSDSTNVPGPRLNHWHRMKREQGETLNDGRSKLKLYGRKQHEKALEIV